jgi:[protein-PII] uridylyltransferase
MARPALRNEVLATEVAAFSQAMPAAYRHTFDAGAIAAHAAIVLGRGAAIVRLEALGDAGGGVLSVCLVADDRPGLLTQVTAAVVAHDLDVVEADAFCRKRADGVVEAVDLVRIRRRDGSALAPSELGPVEATIASLLRGESVASEPDVAPPSRSRGGARLRFDTDPRSGGTVLSVEAFDRPGLLRAITQVLYGADLQIVALRATTRNGRAVDTFELASRDGSPLGQDLRLELQHALLMAIDEASR